MCWTTVQIFVDLLRLDYARGLFLISTLFCFCFFFFECANTEEARAADATVPSSAYTRLIITWHLIAYTLLVHHKTSVPRARARDHRRRRHMGLRAYNKYTIKKINK